MEVRHATNPAESSRYGTAERRAAYLVTDLFPTGTVRAVYAHADRVVVAGTSPAPGEPVPLPAFDPLRSAYFLERRELGVVNIGGAGTVQVDGTEYKLGNRDVLYVGRGARDVVFGSDGDPGARYYLVSAAAHTEYPTRLARQVDVEGIALGSPDTSNDRTLYK